MIEIITILDRSGSMQSVKKDAIGGQNAFLERQKREAPDSRFTLVQFGAPGRPYFQTTHLANWNWRTSVDTDWYQVVHNGVPITSVPPLTEESYVPRGGTALLDAIGKTIDDVGIRLHNTPPHLRPGKILVAILTDGEENSSHQYNSWQIQSMINHQRSVYSWEFIFLAANQDAIQTGGEIGIPKGASINLCHTGAGYQAVGAAISYAARMATSGVAVDAINLQSFYTASVQTEETKGESVTTGGNG